jgi:hypothetical protein
MSVRATSGCVFVVSTAYAAAAAVVLALVGSVLLMEASLVVCRSKYNNGLLYSSDHRYLG